MPNWIAITKDTLYEAKIAIVIDLCNDLLRADGQDERVNGIIAGVVGEVRTAVATCPNNAVDADETTIPKNLRDLTVDMIIARLKGAIEDELTEDERSNLQWRRNQLKAVAACDLRVDSPDNPIAPQVEGSTATQLVRPGRPVDRCDIDRLF